MDLNKIREKLTALDNSRRKSASDHTWKPEEGKQVIRLVPYIHDRDWPFRELSFYYDLAKRTIISPSSFGQPDPILEQAEALERTGDSDDWKFARKIKPKLRTYAPVLVRGKESEGVKFWGFGKTVYNELLKTIDDPDYGDITDLKTGRDITIEYVKPDDGSYPKTTFRVKPNQTPATTDDNVVNLIKQMPAVEDIWEVPTYQELESLFEKFLNNQEGEEESTSTTTSNSTSTNSSLDDLADMKDDLPFDVPDVKEKTTATADIDSAFDDMFG
jgi:hypothetical protein